MFPADVCQDFGRVPLAYGGRVLPALWKGCPVVTLEWGLPTGARDGKHKSKGIIWSISKKQSLSWIIDNFQSLGIMVSDGR